MKYHCKFIMRDGFTCHEYFNFESTPPELFIRPIFPPIESFISIGGRDFSQVKIREYKLIEVYLGDFRAVYREQ